MTKRCEVKQEIAERVAVAFARESIGLVSVSFKSKIMSDLFSHKNPRSKWVWTKQRVTTSDTKIA